MERRRGLAIPLFSLVAVGFLASPASAATALDQSNEAAQVAVDTVKVNQSGGQVFTAGISGELSRVDIDLGKGIGTNAALDVSIFVAVGDQPSGAALASASIAQADVPFVPTWIEVNFPSPARVVSGASYMIVLTSAATTAGYNLELSAADYSRGTYTQKTGAVWNSVNFDLRFRTYVTTADAGPTPPPVLQQFGLPAQDSCDEAAPEALNWGGASSGGWSTSWAEWMNSGLGGAVCTRTLTYSPARGIWIAN